MPVSTRLLDIPHQMGVQAARLRRPGRVIAWCPYDPESHDGARWLAGWYSITTQDPAPRPLLCRPTENQGRNEPLKAGSVISLDILKGRCRVQRGSDVPSYAAANDPLPRAAKDQVHRKRAAPIEWTEANESWLRQLHGDGFMIDDIAGIMNIARYAVQQQGYRMGLSWRGRGTKT
jgi:hypothetical protein